MCLDHLNMAIQSMSSVGFLESVALLMLPSTYSSGKRVPNSRFFFDTNKASMRSTLFLSYDTKEEGAPRWRTLHNFVYTQEGLKRKRQHDAFPNKWVLFMRVPSALSTDHLVGYFENLHTLECEGVDALGVAKRRVESIVLIESAIDQNVLRKFLSVFENLGYVSLIKCCVEGGPASGSTSCLDWATHLSLKSLCVVELTETYDGMSTRH